MQAAVRHPLSWLNRLIWVPIVVPLLAVTLMLLIFPDGRLPSPRWRFAIGTAPVGTGLIAIADSLASFYSGVEVVQTTASSASLTLPSIR
jgi:two-component system NarL family sensor kinase